MMKTYTAGDGARWMFDPERTGKALAHGAGIRAKVENSAVVATKDHWLQRLGPLSMPPNGEVQSNLSKIDAAKSRYIAEYNQQLQSLQSGGWEDLEAWLVLMRQQTDIYNKRMMSMFDEALDLTSISIKSAETGMKVAKFTRDASIASLGIVAVVATGGTALYLATAAQAGLSGVATYQDTGSINKALASGAFAAAPLGAGKIIKAGSAAAGASKGVTAVISVVTDVGMDTAKSMVVDDKSIEKALAGAALDKAIGTGISLGSKQFANQVGETIRDTVRVMDAHGPNGRQSNRATSLLIETFNKSGSELAKGGVSAIAANPSSGTKESHSLAAMRNPMVCSYGSTEKAWVNAHLLRRA